MGGLINELFYGDNLEVLRKHIADESVDLVYLDPPFNSNRSYNVIFGKHAGDHDDDASAQIEAFDDTWRWTPVTDGQYQRYALAGELPEQVGDALTAFRTLLGENDAMAYLVNMAPRIVELHRVLKPTGSLYLHCDPTMSHYLRVLLDAVFSAPVFRSEVIWKRTGAHSSARRYSPLHDTILFYSKSHSYTWNQQYGPYDPMYLAEKFNKKDPGGKLFQDITLTGPETRTGESGVEWRGYNPTKAGRHWALPGYLAEQGFAVEGSTLERLDALDEAGLIYWTRNGVPRLKFYVQHAPGMPLQDIWTDIPPINSQAVERLGYPTQKPIILLERILAASSNPGDVVLDPFCGCGTTIDAAQGLGRKWIGIDITFIAVDLIEKRLLDRYPGIAGTYETFGIPRDIAGAKALFKHSHFDFERWAVSRINARPNEKQVGDKGVDGVARFYLDKKTVGRVLVSVKGGSIVGPQFVRDLLGTVETQKAQMGVLITMTEPTPGVLDAVNHGGTYKWPVNGQTFPRVQVITIAELLTGKRPQMPTLMTPYSTAIKSPEQSTQIGFDELAAGSM